MSNDITIKKEIAPVVSAVESMSLTCPEDMSNATSLLSQLNLFLDGLTKEKELLTKPLNEAIKEVRGRYKPTETMLEEAIATLKKKMGTYQTLALAEQKKAEEKIASKVMDGKLKVETALKKMGDIERPEDKIKTDSGTASFRTVRKFEVMDVTMLPSDYILPNETKIREALKNGVELPGVRYFEEQSIINRRN